MAHDWSGLLGQVEIFSARRASSLIEDDEELRRRRTAGNITAREVSQPRYAHTGIASKARQDGVDSSEPTISSILQVPKSSKQSVISLVGALSAGRNLEIDDEHKKSTGGGGGGTSSGTAPRSAPVAVAREVASDRALAETASRAAIAAGAQPVVIKVTSTVSSRASAAGLMAYLGTREVENENGETGKVDIPIYDQNGHSISSREDRVGALAEWAADFRDAYAVNALATFSVKLSDDVDHASLHDALNAAFSSKPFLYSLNAAGQLSVFAATDLPANKVAGALKARGKGEGSTRVVERAEADFERRLADAGVIAEVRILGAAISEKSGRYFLEKFLRTEKVITSSECDPVKSSPSVKEQADSIWRSWSSHIRTIEPRNAFHVIFSARAGTDPKAMTRAVRDFLSEQVAGHRWMTVHHPDTGHIHVHAMISARDDVGKPLRLTKPELYEWREGFAAKARENGIAMVVTRRADFAATRPYSQAQAGAYERGRQDPRYLRKPEVAKRVERKRVCVVDRVSLANGNLALAPKWQATARALKHVGAQPSVIDAAERFAVAAKDRNAQPAPRRANGFVLLRLEIEQASDRDATAAIVHRLAGTTSQVVPTGNKTVHVLMPTTASVSKIERELAKQNEKVGPGAETASVARSFQERLLAQGLLASVLINAAGSATGSAPSPWLQNEFDALRQRSAQSGRPFAEVKALISDIQQQKDKTMPLSLEQFDERVSRANRSMDRLETMVDSSAERQAVEEMRKEISALFEEQRRDIQLQQMQSVNESVRPGGTPPVLRAEDARAQDRPAPTTVDPAIAAQQQAIAAGRAARAVREQVGSDENAQEEHRQQVLRQAEQERQRGNDRDGTER